MQWPTATDLAGVVLFGGIIVLATWTYIPGFTVIVAAFLLFAMGRWVGNLRPRAANEDHETEVAAPALPPRQPALDDAPLTPYLEAVVERTAASVAPGGAGWEQVRDFDEDAVRDAMREAVHRVNDVVPPGDKPLDLAFVSMDGVRAMTRAAAAAKGKDGEAARPNKVDRRYEANVTVYSQARLFGARLMAVVETEGGGKAFKVRTLRAAGAAHDTSTLQASNGHAPQEDYAAYTPVVSYP